MKRPGLKGWLERRWYGEAAAPKAMNPMAPMADTTTESESYSSMDKNWRWYRQDEMVRRCVNVNAWFSTLAAGFETKLAQNPEYLKNNKPVDLDKFEFVKLCIDAVNKDVNMDHGLFVAQVNRSIYGDMGFEIVLDSSTKLPDWLLILNSDNNNLQPELDKNWRLTGYEYNGKAKAYKPEEVLFFTNLELKADKRGLSDVEPVRDIIEARHELLNNFNEIVRTIWAPYTILVADTAGMTDADETTFLTALAGKARSGKSMAVNKSIDVHMAGGQVNIGGLVNIMEQFEKDIIQEWGTPRFLIGRPVENRATAYAELEAFIDGPVSSIQNDLGRQVEAKWYDPLTRVALENEKQAVADDAPTPVLVKQSWNIIRASDFIALAEAAAQLWGSFGSGPLGGRLDLIGPKLGFTEDELFPKLEDETTAAAISISLRDRLLSAHEAMNGNHSHIHHASEPKIKLGQEEVFAVEQMEQDIINMAAMMKTLANQVIQGQPFDEVFDRGVKAINDFMQRSFENSKTYTLNQLGVIPPDFTTGDMGKFNRWKAEWINDWKRILESAKNLPKDTILAIAFGADWGSRYEASFDDIRFGQGEFWEKPSGVLARLDALSNDLVLRTFNGATQVASSKFGFLEFIWITRPGLTQTGPCPICLPRDGRVFRRGQFMPRMPAHVGCVCVWGIIKPAGEPVTLVEPEA